jgi:hypothetical protein
MGSGTIRGGCLCGACRYETDAMGSLDDPTPFRPEAHIWVSCKQPWLELQGDVPQYFEGTPA